MNKFLIKTIILFLILIAISTTVKAVQNVSTEAEINTAIQNNESEIVLENDIYLENTITIPQGKNIAIDLNGKQITVKKNGARSLYAIDNNGNFTLKDTKGNGAITARGIENLETGKMQIESGIIIACDTNGGASIWNEGELTINGGSLKTTYVGSPSETYGPGCLNNGGKATINGGTFNSVNRRTYAIISTGEIELNNEPQVLGAHGGLAIDAGTAIINGGNYESTEYYGLYVSNDGRGQDPQKAQVIVNGGIYTGKTYSVWIGSDVNNPVNSTIQINGGTFNKPLNVQSNVEASAGIKVYGGKFIEDVSKYITEGYVSTKQDDYYYVLKEYNIVIENLINGTTSTNLQKATAGTNIKITTNANEGYEQGEITVTGKSGNVNVQNNEFKMPEEDVTINVKFNKLTQNIEVTGEEILSIQDKAKVEEILIASLQENPELVEFSKTTNLNIIVQAKDVEISEELQNKMEEILSQKSQDIKIGKFIEITISVRDKNNNNIEVGKLTNLKEPITLTINIPEDMQKQEEGYERTYYIVRDHNGEIEILDTSLSEDGKTLQFTSDKFSTFALAYEDIKLEKPIVSQEDNNTKNAITNPNTGDLIIFAVAVFGTAVAGLIGTNKIKHR